jgi:hypothetical protein
VTNLVPRAGLPSTEPRAQAIPNARVSTAEKAFLSTFHSASGFAGAARTDHNSPAIRPTKRPPPFEIGITFMAEKQPVLHFCGQRLFCYVLIPSFFALTSDRSKGFTISWTPKPTWSFLTVKTKNPTIRCSFG